MPRKQLGAIWRNCLPTDSEARAGACLFNRPDGAVSPCFSERYIVTGRPRGIRKEQGW